ncbi:MAG TPA: multicopper oxidase domain-containing protein, partial [Candidatus Eremiobacteraceae bacterium]|nr:multicopper oxidase domain-containing protein [Candidatus Eremiobacteraceae bacterium]
MRRVLLSLFGVALLFGALTCQADAATRTYYIAADEVVWNYAPTGKDVIQGKALPPLAPLQLGWSYRKAVYHEYTDATFKHIEPRPADEAYMGLLGPILHAEVGDTIVIHFKNNTRFPMSIHTHGMLYTKASEGALYADGTSGADKLDDGVPTGHTYTYSWQVPERSGPGPMDGSSVMWMFHSHTDEVHDVNSGPVGGIVVTRKGMARPDGTPKDVDR